MGLWNVTKTVALLSLLTGLFMGVGYYMGGSSGALTALVFAGFTNLLAFWFSDKIVLSMYGAKELTAAQNHTIHQVVNKISEEMEIPKPRIYLVNTPVPNAFAVGRSPSHSAVAVTKGLLDRLEPGEIEAVLSHELAHVKNRDTLVSTMAATIAGAITWIAQMLSFGLMFGGRDRGNAAGALFMMIVAPIAAMLVQLAISRTREYGADYTGAMVSKKPLQLASALKKIHSVALRAPLDVNPSTAHLFIVNPLSPGGIAKLFSTHPPMEERVKRLEELNRKIRA